MFKKNNEKGFTLIELMIVIAIIGILAAVAVPNFLSYRNKAYCTSVEGDARTAITALSSYFSDPSKISLPTFAHLKAKEKFSLSTSSTSAVTGSNTDLSKMWVTVTKATTNKCPNGSTFTAYLGGDGGSNKWK